MKNEGIMTALSLEAILMPLSRVLPASLEINTLSVPFGQVIPEFSFITHVPQYLQAPSMPLPVSPLALVELVSDQVAHDAETFDLMPAELSLIDRAHLEEESALPVRDTIDHLSDIG